MKQYGIAYGRVGEIEPGAFVRAPEFGVDQWMRVVPTKDGGQVASNNAYRTLTLRRSLPDGQVREVTTDPLWIYDLVEIQVEIKSSGPGLGVGLGVAIPLG
jgi:hypothetical protein